MNDHELLAEILRPRPRYRLTYTVVYDTHEGWSVHPHSEANPMVDKVVSEYAIDPVLQLPSEMQDLFHGALDALRALLAQENGD